MKICHIANYIPGYHRGSGGAEEACLNTVKALYEQGIENIVAAVRPNKQPQEKEFNFYSITISEDIIGWKPSFFKRFFNFDIISYFSLKRILKKVRPGVVHLHNFDLMSLSAISAAKSLKIPVVFSVYDYWIFSKDKGITFNDGWLRRKIFNHFIKKIDAFIVLSEHSRDLLLDNGIPENKIYIVHLMMKDALKVSADNNIDRNIIFFAGWVQPRKGLYILAQAMKEVAQKFPQAKILVAGMKEDKRYREEIDRFIISNNLQKNIEWKNREDDTDGQFYKTSFAKASAIAVPEQWQNMSPVIVAEGLREGKVVIASRIGGIPYIIEDGVSGLLAKYDTPADFADKIIKLLSFSNEDLSAIRDNARKRYEALFNSADNAKKMISVYNSLYEHKR